MRPNLIPSQDRPAGSGLLGWAVSLLAAAGVVYLTAQLHLTLFERQRLQAASEEGVKRLNVLANSVKQAEDAYQKRDAFLTKNAEVNAKISAFYAELLDLAKTDTDARNTVRRWKLQPNGKPEAPSNALSKDDASQKVIDMTGKLPKAAPQAAASR
jgi:hypothetical protein